MESVLYIWDNVVPSIKPCKGKNSKVSKEVMLCVKGEDPESKAESINGNS